MPLIRQVQAVRAALLAAALLLLANEVGAGPLRERLAERRAAQNTVEELDDEGFGQDTYSLPAGTRLIRDVAYGKESAQRFDVYAPAQASNAPVLLMVHGGGWARGDKAMPAVFENKVARWVPRGFIVVSTNYRMLPGAGPLEQAGDVARALAAAQAKAASWGGDPKRFVLMGHSAGAHLVALLTAAPALAAEAGAGPWLGTIALDSAALDVVQTMQGRHLRLYDRAFGSDPPAWRAASPYQALSAATAPFLAVCSTRRHDACPQAAAFTEKARSLGTRASVLKENLSHRDINLTLGLPGSYTDLVEAFLAGLDPAVARALGR